MAATEETPLCVQQRAPQPKGAYVLIIKVEFKKGLKQEFLNQWQPLAEYVRLHEPNTLTYELAHDTADPDVVFIYERYTTKDDLKITHDSSKMFKKLQQWMGTHKIVAKREAYELIESNIGFVVRD